MKRFKLIAFTMSTLLLGSCATQQPKPDEADKVDALIASYAQSATNSLRKLSEAEGASRVVTKGTIKNSGSVATYSVPNSRTDDSFQPYRPPASPSVTSSAQETRAVRASAENGISLSSSSGDRASSSTVIQSQPTSTGGLLSTAPDGLSKIITVRWTGDIEELIEKISQEVRWAKGPSTGFKVSPVVVSIIAENRPAYEVLRDVGAMSGGAATVVVSASSKLISVRYPTR